LPREVALNHHKSITLATYNTSTPAPIKNLSGSEKTQTHKRIRKRKHAHTHTYTHTARTHAHKREKERTGEFTLGNFEGAMEATELKREGWVLEVLLLGLAPKWFKVE
jgi:hypothetical protein